MKAGLVRSAVIVALLGTGAMALWGLDQYREHRMREKPLLPVQFDHADHREQRCTTCHHNFTDSTGGGTCYACHKQDPALAVAMERTYHDLCRGCHVEEHLAGNDAGPTRACSGCHIGNTL